nr:MAG: wsv143-like protein [Chiromantes dehaani nimavirus]
MSDSPLTPQNVLLTEEILEGRNGEDKNGRENFISASLVAGKLNIARKSNKKFTPYNVKKIGGGDVAKTVPSTAATLAKVPSLTPLLSSPSPNPPPTANSDKEASRDETKVEKTKMYGKRKERDKRKVADAKKLLLNRKTIKKKAIRRGLYLKKKEHITKLRVERLKSKNEQEKVEAANKIGIEYTDESTYSIQPTITVSDGSKVCKNLLLSDLTNFGSSSASEDKSEISGETEGSSKKTKKSLKKPDKPPPPPPPTAAVQQPASQPPASSSLHTNNVEIETEVQHEIEKEKCNLADDKKQEEKKEKETERDKKLRRKQRTPKKKTSSKFLHLSEDENEKSKENESSEDESEKSGENEGSSKKTKKSLKKPDKPPPPPPPPPTAAVQQPASQPPASSSLHTNNAEIETKVQHEKEKYDSEMKDVSEKNQPSNKRKKESSLSRSSASEDESEKSEENKGSSKKTKKSLKDKKQEEEKEKEAEREKKLRKERTREKKTSSKSLRFSEDENEKSGENESSEDESEKSGKNEGSDKKTKKSLKKLDDKLPPPPPPLAGVQTSQPQLSHQPVLLSTELTSVAVQSQPQGEESQPQQDLDTELKTTEAQHEKYDSEMKNLSEKNQPNKRKKESSLSRSSSNSASEDESEKSEENKGSSKKTKKSLKKLDDKLPPSPPPPLAGVQTSEPQLSHQVQSQPQGEESQPQQVTEFEAQHEKEKYDSEMNGLSEKKQPEIFSNKRKKESSLSRSSSNSASEDESEISGENKGSGKKKKQEKLPPPHAGVQTSQPVSLPIELSTPVAVSQSSVQSQQQVLDTEVNTISHINFVHENVILKNQLSNLEEQTKQSKILMDQRLKELEEKLKQLLEQNNMVVSLSSDETAADMEVAAADIPTKDASMKNFGEAFSVIMRWAVNEMHNNNSNLVQTFIDTMAAEKTSQNKQLTVSVENMEKTMQKIWSSKVSSDAKIHVATDAVETMVSDLNKVQENIKANSRVLSEIKKTNTVPFQELVKARDNTANSLALFVQQIYTLYFNIKRDLDNMTNNNMTERSDITKYLNDAKVVLTSDIFIDAIKNFNTLFSYSDGTPLVKSFKAAAANHNKTPSTISVTAPDDHSDDEFSATMLSQKYQTVIFLNTITVFELNNAKRILEEAKHQQELKDAAEQERTARMNQDLTKLSHSLEKKIIPAITDEANSFIKEAIVTDGVSVLHNVKTIISYYDNKDLPNTLKDNLIKLKEFLITSKVVDNNETTMGVQQLEVAMAASNLFSSIEDIYNRGIVATTSMALIDKGTAAAVEEAKLVISDTLSTFLAEARKSTQDITQQQHQVIKQLQIQEEKRAQNVQATERESATAGGGGGTIAIHGSGNGLMTGNGGGLEKRGDGGGGGGGGGGSSSRGEEETDDGGGNPNDACIQQVAKEVALNYRKQVMLWVQEQIDKLTKNPKKTEMVTINEFMIAGFKKITNETTLLFTRFVEKVMHQCKVSDFNRLALFVNILLNAQKEVDKEFKEKISMFFTEAASLQRKESAPIGGEDNTAIGDGGGKEGGGISKCIEEIANRLSSKHAKETKLWITEQIEHLDTKLANVKSQDDLKKVRDAFHMFIPTGYEEIRKRTIHLFNTFIDTVMSECKTTPHSVFLHESLSKAQDEIDETFKDEIEEFSSRLQEKSDEIQQQQKKSAEISPLPMEIDDKVQHHQQQQATPMEVDEKNLMDEKFQEAKQELLNIVKWATRTIPNPEISQDTKNRKIIASLEGGKNVITMEVADLSADSSDQVWTPKNAGDPFLDQYKKEEPYVLRAVSEMKRTAGNLTNRPTLRFVKRHGITTQGFPYYLNRLELDKTPVIITHPEFMRPLVQTATAVLPDSPPFDNKEQAFKILASDLMKTLKDTTHSATTTTTTTLSPDIPNKLNMLIYNIFVVDANVLKNISAVCYTFRTFLTTHMADKAVKDKNVRSKLLEATVAILFTACRHVFNSIANNNNNAMSQLTQVLEQRLAAMASRRNSFSPSSVGDEFRVRVCYIMYSYLHKYLRLCIRRVDVCLRSLRFTGLASKKMMAAPQMAESVGSQRVSSFEVQYDFVMLYKLLSFQSKNISLLSELAFETLKSIIAALAVFVNNAKLPIFNLNQKSTIPLVGNEIVLPANGATTDTIHAIWNITVLNELSQSLTQYLAWLSKNDGEEEEEPEKLIRVCRAAAGAVVTCLKTIEQQDDDNVKLILAPVEHTHLKGWTYKLTKKNAAEAVTTVLTKISPKVLEFEKSITNINNSTVGSILASTTKAGSIAAAAHIFISGFKDYLHDPEDFWGACVLFPPDGEGTELEGWAKAYRNSQDVLEDFSDLSVENNSSVQGLLVPPDFALVHLNNNIINNSNNNTIRGSNGYDIKTRDGGPPIWWSNNTEGTSKEESGLIKLADGVTISVPGKDKLRKSVLLTNALKNNYSSVSYTRPVFDTQFQTNVHFETPRLVLLPRQHQWTCNIGGDASSAVSAAVWNLPSIKLLYQELTLKEEENDEDSTVINVDDSDINRAIGDIQSCSKEFDFSAITASSEDDNNASTMAITSAVKTIISKKKNNETEDKKYSVVDELALAPALLRRSGTAPFKPAAFKACGMFMTPGKRSRSNNNKRSSWWTSDATLMERAERAAEKLLVLTPSLLDIHPPTEQSIKRFV